MYNFELSLAEFNKQYVGHELQLFHNISGAIYLQPSAVTKIVTGTPDDEP